MILQVALIIALVGTLSGFQSGDSWGNGRGLTTIDGVLYYTTDAGAMARLYTIDHTDASPDVYRRD